MIGQRFLDRLFFAPRSPLGFGLMRALWGTVVFLSTASLIADRHVFFADTGLLPPGVRESVLRGDVRFSLLDTFGSTGAIDIFFLFLLFFAACTAIGAFPRLSTTVTLALLLSLHERNPFVFAGGDTVLRLLGLILVVAPSLSAFSLSGARRYIRACNTGTKVSQAQDVPSYAYRLLLWQLIVLYGCSLWEKLSGDMWIQGTAAESVFHHAVFSRMPLWLANTLTPLSPYVSRATLVFHALWLLLLIPTEVTALLPRWVPRFRLKRIVIFIGMLFHGSILLLLDAGDFSLAMFAAYLGLLDADDFTMLRTLWNWRWRGHIAVLYDGKCGLCRRSVAVLTMFDWGKRLLLVDLHDAPERKKHAPHITLDELDRALHIVLPKGTTLSGFGAFRELAEHLPPLVPLLPLLWLPGVERLGNAFYAHIATARKGCRHGHCAI